MTDIWLVSYLVLWCLAIFLGAVLVGVLRHIGILYERYQQASGIHPAATSLKAGDEPKDAVFPNMDGALVPLSSVRGSTAAFAVVSADCSFCRDLLRDIAKGAFDEEGVERWVVVSMNDAEATRGILPAEVALPLNTEVLIDANQRLSDLWGVVGTPVTVVVDADFKIVKQIVGPGSPDGLAPVPGPRPIPVIGA
jgi:AhpC/TSA family